MSEVAVEIEVLDNHAALASRLIRTKPAWQSYFRWFNRPGMRHEPTQAPSAAVKDLFDSLIGPLLVDSDRATQREAEMASAWLGAICEYLAGRHRSPGNQFLMRQIAASLLPLYRTLATGRLQEGLSQTRHRLGETLVLVGLNEILQLMRLFEIQATPQNSPHRVVGENLKIDPSNVFYLICRAIEGYNQAKDSFNQDATKLLSEFRAGDTPLSYQIPEWSATQLLWVLSNELTSSRSELVLPRSWLDVPVPWSKISAHWIELEAALCNIKSEPERQSRSAATRVEADTRNVPAREQEHASTPVVDVASAANTALQQAEAIVDATQSGLDGLQAMDVIDQVIEQELYRKSQPMRNSALNKAVGATAANRNATAGSSASKRDTLPIAKVIIGEISNHNDPAFANVVRRQVAMCKQEDRSICLSMILVTAEDQRENQNLSAPHDNGLNRWQQKLVNWICDHPELKQPSAFLTREGQLILVVMDSERNAMTRILRQGLVEILTGQKDDGRNDLTKVTIPAKFHAGIASITSPGASFEFEELISSSHRCFTAAQRLGSASIKSIEVF